MNSVIYFGLTIPVDLLDNLVFTRTPASFGCMFVFELNCETDSSICFDISRHIVRSSASKPDLNMVAVIRMKNNQCFTFCTYPDMILLFQSMQTIIHYWFANGSLIGCSIDFPYSTYRSRLSGVTVRGLLLIWIKTSSNVTLGSQMSLRLKDLMISLLLGTLSFACSELTCHKGQIGSRHSNGVGHLFTLYGKWMCIFLSNFKCCGNLGAR